MQAYFTRLILAAAAVGLAESILPERKQTGLRLICGLLLLTVVALPLVEAIERGDLAARIEDILARTAQTEAVDAYAAQAMAAIRDASEERAAAEIEALLTARFGIEPEQMRVEVVLADDGAGGVAFVGARAWLSGSAALADAAAIEAYLTALLGGKIIVAIE